MSGIRLGIKAFECPFCGSTNLEARTREDGNGLLCGVFIECQECESTGPVTPASNAGNANDARVYHPEILSAILNWNARTRSHNSVAMTTSDDHEWVPAISEDADDAV